MLPERLGWQIPGPAADTQPWPPWFPSCHCTHCPRPKSRSSLPEPPHDLHKGYDHRLSAAVDRGSANKTSVVSYSITFKMAEGESYSAVETHGGNVTLDGSIFLVAAAH